MKVSIADIRKLKAQVQKLNSSKSNGLKPIPDRWVDFSNLVKIKTGKGYLPFEPFQYQVDFIDLVEKCPMTLVAKTRQLGYSIAIVNWLIFKALSEPGIDCAVFSLNQQSTSQLAKQARNQLDSLDTIYCNVVSDSLTSISFSNGSNIYFRNSSVDATRGLTLKYLVLDEMGFITQIEELFGAISPCLTIYGDDARVIGVSTPNMNTGMYFDLLTKNNGDTDVLDLAEEIKDGRKQSTCWIDEFGTGKMLAHWRDNPTIKDKEAYLLKVAKRFNLDVDTVEREYNLSFSSSAESVFSPSLIREACTGTLKKARSKASRVFAGIDPNASSGSKSDYFVMSIFEEKNDKIELIDYYRARGVTSEAHVYEIGKYLSKYKDIEVIAVESNNSGNIYIERLANAYPSQHFEPVHTSNSSKEANISRFKMAMESKVLLLPDDKNLVNELLSFQKVGSKMEAVGKNSYDDFVMSIAIALTQSEYATTPNERVFEIDFKTQSKEK